MKRTFFFILLVAGISLQAQQTPTNGGPTPSGAAPDSVEFRMNPDVGQFAFETSHAARTNAIVTASGGPEVKLPLDFRIEKAEPRDPLFRSALTYSGVVVDLRSIRQVPELFSLKKPFDPSREFKNVLLDVRTERPRGIVFFSLNF